MIKDLNKVADLFNMWANIPILPGSRYVAITENKYLKIYLHVKKEGTLITHQKLRRNRRSLLIGSNIKGHVKWDWRRGFISWVPRSDILVTTLIPGTKELQLSTFLKTSRKSLGTPRLKKSPYSENWVFPPHLGTHAVCLPLQEGLCS